MQGGVPKAVPLIGISTVAEQQLNLTSKHQQMFLFMDIRICIVNMQLLVQVHIVDTRRLYMEGKVDVNVI